MDEKGLDSLKKKRAKILKDIHKKQKILDEIDYSIYLLKKGE